MSTTKRTSRMKALWNSSLINGSNVHYVEALYERYLANPADVPEEWRHYFDTLGGNTAQRDVTLSMIREQFRRQSQSTASSGVDHAERPFAKRDYTLLEAQLCDAYRRDGHHFASLNPLAISHVALDQMPMAFSCPSHARERMSPNHGMTLGALQQRLQAAYCGTVGAEFMTIDDEAKRRWIQKRVESRLDQPLSVSEQRQVLDHLMAAEGLEQFLANRFPGAKRFGLEGCESLMPLLHALIAAGAQHHIKSAVLGMAHRGRLNVMVNLLGKPVSDLIDEFEGRYPAREGSGDVKYHMGREATVKTEYGDVALSLLPNPSHLEIVAPVVTGVVRAQQARLPKNDRRHVVPVVMHGDAAFAAQGVVMETFQLSRARAFETGGTLHIVINNQVGFTTSHPEDARSTPYCTDIARMMQIPVLHVNADDPDAVVWAARTAVVYRQTFGDDIIIDLIGFRRRGHNEADEPSGTQPLMYAQIRQHPGVCTYYAQHCVAAGVLSKSDVQRRQAELRDALEQGESLSISEATSPTPAHSVSVPACSQEALRDLALRLNTAPEHFSLQRQVARVYEERRQMAQDELPVNWGFAELLAYATLIETGCAVRLVGQDSGRGTFSHRHAVLHDQATGERWTPLQHLSVPQPLAEVYDSLLSEEAVMAFEYGYAVASPNTLVLWEAQFGDFANGAQVVIDQFLASAATKWGQTCGLTLLLPHGFEGQGPEHSSARLERFLQLCAEDNMRVCTPTTPAQMYHLLRHQAADTRRRPLILMQPKSLLRHRSAVSSCADLASGHFQPVLQDSATPSKVRRIIVTSGKVYYDLNTFRQTEARHDTALIRLETLYPFPDEALSTALAAFSEASTVVWCQEEPMNQGAWSHIRDALQDVVDRSLPGSTRPVRAMARPPAAAPACGDAAEHARQQTALVKAAFDD